MFEVWSMVPDETTPAYQNLTILKITQARAHQRKENFAHDDAKDNLLGVGFEPTRPGDQYILSLPP
jgi:hypothetical protein